MGRALGDTFLLVVHAGRKTGKLHSMVAMALRYDPRTREAVICSAWGQDADWVRNIRAHPAVRVQIGPDSFTPAQRFLSEEESVAVVAEFQRAHPGRSRLLSAILGLGRSPLGRGCAGVRQHPAVCLLPPGRPLPWLKTPAGEEQGPCVCARGHPPTYDWNR